MKKILLSLTAIAIAITSMAQSLTTSGLSVAPSIFDATILVASVNVTNNTNTDKNVFCSRTQNNLFAGHVSHFCWDLCYGPQTNVSNNYVTIPAMSTNSVNFVGDLETGGLAGSSDVTYTFYVDGNITDQTSVVINYNYTTGINDISSGKAQISSARPNPADAFTTMSYSLKADPSFYKIELVNMVGSKVAEYSLQTKNGVVTIPTNELNSGIYFYVLKENNKTISSQKLVVSHK